MNVDTDRVRTQLRYLSRLLLQDGVGTLQNRRAYNQMLRKYKSLRGGSGGSVPEKVDPVRDVDVDPSESAYIFHQDFPKGISNDAHNALTKEEMGVIQEEYLPFVMRNRKLLFVKHFKHDDVKYYFYEWDGHKFTLVDNKMNAAEYIQQISDSDADADANSERTVVLRRKRATRSDPDAEAVVLEVPQTSGKPRARKDTSFENMITLPLPPDLRRRNPERVVDLSPGAAARGSSAGAEDPGATEDSTRVHATPATSSEQDFIDLLENSYGLVANTSVRKKIDYMYNYSFNQNNARRAFSIIERFANHDKSKTGLLAKYQQAVKNFFDEDGFNAQQIDDLEESLKGATAEDNDNTKYIESY